MGKRGEKSSSSTKAGLLTGLFHWFSNLLQAALRDLAKTSRIVFEAALASRNQTNTCLFVVNEMEDVCSQVEATVMGHGLLTRSCRPCGISLFFLASAPSRHLALTVWEGFWEDFCGIVSSGFHI